MAPAKLSDIASSLGLNIATISRALREDPRIKTETRLKIKEEAARLGYRPHWGARALAEGRSRTFLFLVPSLESPIERGPATWAGLWLHDRGYDLMMAQHYGDTEVYARILDRLANGGADGAVIIPGFSAKGGDNADKVLAQTGVPFVYLDRKVSGVSAPVVTTDNHGATVELVDRLVHSAQQAEKPLKWVYDAFVPDFNNVEADRSRGLRAAAARHGLAVYSVREGFSPSAPGAFLASSVGTLKNFQASWPAHCRAAVFDDAEGFTFHDQLLVAKQDFKTLGETAAGLLLKAQTNPEFRTMGPQEFQFPLVSIEEANLR